MHVVSARPHLLATLALLLALPAFAQPLAKPIRVNGVVHIDITDVIDDDGNIIGTVPPETATLHRGKKRRTVIAYDQRLVPGAKVRVRGSRFTNGALVPDEVKVVKLPPQTPALENEYILVLPVDFSDNQRGLTQAQIQAVYEQDTRDLAQVSYGRTKAPTIDVRPWRRAPMTQASLGGVCSKQAVAFATALHPDADYRRATIVIQVYPQICAPTGSLGRYWEQIDAHTQIFIGAIWNSEGGASLLHEIGHTQGMGHANDLECLGGAPLVADTRQCTNIEYGDALDYMGASQGDLHAIHKRQLGYLTTTGPERFERVFGPGTWTLDPIETPAAPGMTSLKALFIPRATVPTTWLTVEARRGGLGLDRFYTDSRFEGAILHTHLAPFALFYDDIDGQGTPGYISQEPYMTHLVSIGIDEYDTDAMLRVGQVFRDPVGPFQVRVLARSSTDGKLTVAVEPLGTTPPPTFTPHATFTPRATLTLAPTPVPGSPCCAMQVYPCVNTYPCTPCCPLGVPSMCQPGWPPCT